MDDRHEGQTGVTLWIELDRDVSEGLIGTIVVRAQTDDQFVGIYHVRKVRQQALRLFGHA